MSLMTFSNADSAQSRPLPPCGDNEFETTAWGIENFGEDFKVLTISKAEVGERDVRIEMKYCGICHTDVHMCLNEMSAVYGTMYPVVPGHELVGTVSEVGSGVTKFKAGDNVAVGCIRDSCMECKSCKEGHENYCEKGFVHTYNTLKHKEYSHIGGNQETQNCGGYTEFDVFHEHFVHKIPEGMPLEKTAPILCAGITMWSPLEHWGATVPGGRKMDIGIVGVGGLGTMGIKLAAALGHRVVAISTSSGKEELAREKGAQGFVVSTDTESVSKESKKLDIILNTVSAHHSISPYLDLLASSGVLVQLGCVGSKPMQFDQDTLMFRRLSIASSLIGGITATQKLLEFCKTHDIYPDIEVVTADKLGEVYKSLQQDNNSHASRYVLDIKKSLDI